ncbi:MAG TPA: PRC and DUF2382 domain-containing protein, partial [Candidatus Saccharimonadales bacterium]|nr:PRC and DUF2382 domain-containing protein [Candidatus Saccharimonadales bacterium]
MKNQNQTDLSKFIGHRVVDRNGSDVGTLECLWSDHNGEPAFLGVKTGWFIGRTHVVPAQRAEVNTSGSTIRLPYDESKIKEAPSSDADAQLDERTEREVSTYYDIPWRAAEQQPAQSQRPETRQEGRGQETASVQLSQEEIKVGKRQVEYGGVRLRKIIRTETVNQPVELTREEIVIERVPAGQGTKGGKAFNQEEVYIPLRREEAVVQKESRVTEEVRARKRTETEKQTVSGQVRKEDVEIERGAGNRQATGTSERRATPVAATQNSSRPAEGGRKAVFCITKSEQQASKIAEQLKSAGFSRDDISVIFSDKRTSKEFAHEKNTKAPEGATTGAVSGGAIGGTLGWLAGIGALTIPGVGPFIAAGP